MPLEVFQVPATLRTSQKNSSLHLVGWASLPALLGMDGLEAHPTKEVNF
jgi:hypothetical protein